MLTACLIVRNEANVIERCLSSISAFVDDCCVLDTGSSDGTVELAERFGARVIVDLSFADTRGRLRDFAAARNAALSMAHTNWVLSIDADEVLDVVRPSSARAMLQDSRVQAIEVQIRSGGTHWYLPRLFVKKP